MLAKEGPEELSGKLAAALGSQGIFFVTSQILSHLYLLSFVCDDGQEEKRSDSVPQTSRTREYEIRHDTFVARSVARSKHVSYRSRLHYYLASGKTSPASEVYRGLPSANFALRVLI